MATIGHDHNGHKRILFQFNGARRTVRLGQCTEKQAQVVRTKIESLIATKITGQQDDEVSRWLAGLPDELHSRIAKTGLLPPRMHLRQTLGVLLCWSMNCSKSSRRYSVLFPILIWRSGTSAEHKL